jgi:c-di-GMP phosphodiesterase
MSYCIHLKPICNADMRHVADELLYRNPAGRHDDLLNPTTQAARACSTALFEIGLQRLVGSRPLVLRVTGFLLQRLPHAGLPADQVILRPIPGERLDADMARLLEQARAEGFQVMVDMEQLDPTLELFPDIVTLPVGTAEAGSRLDILPKGARRMAVGIETAEHLELAGQWRCEWFQGPYFSTPVPISSPIKRRTSNLPAQLQLLQELYKTDPDLGRVGTLIAQDPHLAVLVLRETARQLRNGAGSVLSLNHACLLLGLDYLQAIITQLLLAQNAPGSSLQLKHMLLRAALCKRVSRRLRLGDPNEAFLLGLFSLMDSYLQIGMQELVEMIPFQKAAREALLHRTGPHGRLIKLIESFEVANTEDTEEQVLAILNAEYLDSLAWLNKVMVQPEE